MSKIINPSVIYRRQSLLDDEKNLVRQQIKAVEAVEGKGLSTSDYTADEKIKLAGISQNAEANAIKSISFNDTLIEPDDNKNVNIVIDTVSDDADGLMSVADKTKLDGIAEGAEPNVTPDWNAAEGTDGYIDNKPTIPSTAADVGAAPADHTHTAADVGAAPAEHTHTQDDVEGLTEIAQKIDTIDEGAQVNVIEKITVNGAEQPITNKTVAITVSAEGSYTEGNGISISNSKEISVDAGNGLDFDGENKLIVDSKITDAVENAHTLTYENGVEIIDDTDTKTTTIKLEDELYEKISTPLELVEGTNISFDTTDAGKLKISATGGGIASVETDGTTILGDGTTDDKIRLAVSPLELDGVENQISITPSTGKLNIGLASAVTTELAAEQQFRGTIDTTIETKVDTMKASAISETDTGLATADLVASAIGKDIQMSPGDGIKFTQSSATAPLEISMDIPIVIETDPDSFIPVNDGKLHFVVMKKA